MCACNTCLRHVAEGPKTSDNCHAGLQGLGPSWPSVLAALTSFSDVANTPFSAAIAYVESLGAHLLHSPATQPGLHMPVATAAFMPSPVLQQLSISGGYNAAAQSANSVGQFNFPAATAPFAPGQTSAQVSPACLVSAGDQPDVCGCPVLTGLNMLPGLCSLRVC